MAKKDKEDLESAARGRLSETAVALHLLSAEGIHEAVHTLNFLRYLLDEEAAGSLSVEAAGFAQQEIERLEQLLANLRRFKLPAPRFAPVTLRTIVEQAVRQLRGSVKGRRSQVTIEVPAQIRVRADRAFLGMALSSLLTYALSLSPTGGGSIAVKAVGLDSADSASIQIETPSASSEALSQGTGMPQSIWEVAPFEASSLSWVIAHRLLRHIGWTLAYERTSACIIFRLTSSLP